MSKTRNRFSFEVRGKAAAMIVLDTYVVDTVNRLF